MNSERRKKLRHSRASGTNKCRVGRVKGVEGDADVDGGECCEAEMKLSEICSRPANMELINLIC